MKKLALAILLIVIATGCTATPTVKEKEILSILYSSAAQFKIDYGGSIQQKFKDHVQIEIIEYESLLGVGRWNDLSYVPETGEDWDSKALLKLIAEKNPDILFFPASVYRDLLEANVLIDASDHTNSDDLKEIDAHLLDAFRTMGDGRIYFLSDLMATESLYVNKDLFKKYNLSEPHDYMNWTDILHLASQISERGKDDNIVGLLTPNHSVEELFLRDGQSKGLKWYDSTTQRTYFSNESWKSVLENIIQLEQANKNIKLDKRASELFSNGQVGMVLETFRMTDELNINQNDVDWSVVTAPVYDHAMGTSDFVAFEYGNGINKNSAHLDSAIEIWTYINSKDAARKKHLSNPFKYTIPVRSAVIKDNEMRNLAAFHKLSPVSPSETMEVVLPMSIRQEVKRYLWDQLQLILSGSITVDDSLAKWDEELPALIGRLNE